MSLCPSDDRGHFNSSKSFLFSVVFLVCDLLPCDHKIVRTITQVFPTSSGKNGYKIILIRAYNLIFITFCKILAFTRFYDYKYKHKHSTSRRSISEMFPDTNRVRATEVPEMDGTVLWWKLRPFSEVCHWQRVLKTNAWKRRKKGQKQKMHNVMMRPRDKGTKPNRVL